MVSWAREHWRSIAAFAVATLVFTAVAILTGGLGAPLLVALAAGGFASGVAGYATQQLLEERSLSLRDALLQGALATGLTLATLGIGRALAPIASRALGRLLPQLAAPASPALAGADAGAKNVALGFFKVMPAFKKATNSIDYNEWFRAGLVADGDAFVPTLRAGTASAIQSGGRIKFNLTNMRFPNALRVNERHLPYDPLGGGKKDYVRVTEYELAQIRFNRTLWDNTDFFLAQADGAYSQLGPAELAGLGLRYEGAQASSAVAPSATPRSSGFLSALARGE